MRWSSSSSKGWIFHFPTMFRTVLRTTIPLVQWIPRASLPGGKATGAQSWQFTSIEGCDLVGTCTWSSLPDQGKNLYLRYEVQTDCEIQLTCYSKPGVLSSKPERDHLPRTRTVEWKAYNYFYIPYAPSWCGVQARDNFTFTSTVTLDPDTCLSPTAIYFIDPTTPVHVKWQHEK
jgi:hypothetical protein